ncbi:hypothetical protein HPULCUR_011990 [Helicostylum pulchrum]|uniref:Uncharacterized protein n=1 Tax=Helicostylum pulchrum TaxID=562976 RepID=A0ABP9YHN1_9FUNG
MESYSFYTRSDGMVTSVPIGSIGQQTESSKLPTADLGNGNTISDYKGPGIYTVSPGNVVSVGSAGDYSFISGTGASGVNVGSTSLPSAQFPTSTPFNPQSDNATPGFSLSTRPDGVVTSVPVGSTGQQTESSKLPTADLGNGNTISDYKGPGIYTVSPGNVVSVGSAGDYSFISGTGASGVNGGSTSLPSAQFPTSTPFNPQSDNATPGFSLSTRPDGVVTSVPVGSTGQQTESSKLPTADLGNGNTISDYKGPGIYTVSPGNVVSVGSAGDYSFISGTGASGVNGGSTSLPSAQFPTSTPFNPQSDNATPGFSLSTRPDGVVTSVPVGSTGQQTESSKLPTADLGNGNTISDYKGPGIYTVSPGNVVSVGSAGDYSFISGTGASGVNGGSTSLPSAQFPTSTPFNPQSDNATPSFRLSTRPDGVVTSVPVGSTGQQTESSKLPTADLGNGNTISDYKGPGIYTVSPGNVVSVGSAGDYSFISGTGASGVNGGSTSLPSAQFPTSTPFNPQSDNATPSFRLSTRPDGVVTSVPAGSIGQQTGSSKLPTADLGNGNTISDYKGPGIYTVSPGNVVSVGSAGDYSFISGTGASGVNVGSTSLPSAQFPTSTPFNPQSDNATPSFRLSTRPDGVVTSVPAGSIGQQTGSSKLPTADLGNGNTISDYKGPGIYTVSPGNVVSVGSAGDYSFISGTGASGVNVGSTSLPSAQFPTSTPFNPQSDNATPSFRLSTRPDGVVTSVPAGSIGQQTGSSKLPTADLGNGNTISDYKGPGIYTVSPGNVVSVGSAGDYSFISGTGASGVNGGSTSLPSAQFPTSTPFNPQSDNATPSFRLSTRPDGVVTSVPVGSTGQQTESSKLPTADLGNGNTISDYKGPGIYTVSPGNVVSVGSAGDYSFISGTGASGVNVGSTSLPSAQFPTSTPFNPQSDNATPSFRLSTRPDGVVTSVPVGSTGQQTESSKLPTADLGNGNTISDYKGPGIYTVSPGNVVSVGSAGDYSFISGTGASGVNGGSTSLPSAQFPTSTPFNPQSDNATPSFRLSTRPDGVVTSVPVGSTGQQTESSKLPTADLGNGNTISDYKGPGIYTVSPGNVVSVGSAGDYSFISGTGASGVNGGSTSLPSAQFPTSTPFNPQSDNATPSFRLSTRPDGVVTSVPVGSTGQQTESSKLPTADLGNGNTISDYKGPGIYTVSPGNVVSVGSAGDYSFISGTGASGVNGGSTSLPSAQFPTSTPFNPQSDNATPSFRLSTRPDGVVTSVPVGSTGQQTESSKLPTADLGNGNTISDYKGPGIYTVSPGNVVSVGSAGDYSFISGTGASGVNGGSTSLPSAQFPTSTPFNPQSDNATPSFRLSTRPDGVVTSVPAGSTGQQTESSKLPTADLGNGNTISDYKGPGIYTVSPGNVVSVGSAGDYSFISGTGASGVNVGSTSLPSAQFPTSTPFNPQSDNATPSFRLSTRPDGVVTSVPAGSTGQQTESSKLPTADLGNGNTISDYKGPGIYTVSPGNVVSVGSAGDYSFISGTGASGVNGGSTSLPSAQFPTSTPFNPQSDNATPSFRLSTRPDGVVTSVPAGSTGQQTESSKLPTADLGNGNTISDYKGPGIYTVSPGNVVSVGSAGDYSFISGTGASGVNVGSTSLPSAQFPTSTPFNPQSDNATPGFSLSTRPDGVVTSVPVGSTGQQTESSKLPTADLGNGNTISDYKGPGIYTVSPGNVVSVGSAGDYSFISGTGASGVNGGSTSLPSAQFPTSTPFNPQSDNATPGFSLSTRPDGVVTSVPVGSTGQQTESSKLPTADLGNGNTISDYKGPGIYTVSPGNVVSVGSAGDYSFISGTGASGVNVGSTSLPSAQFPTVTLGDGDVITGYTGPGTYKDSGGHPISVGSDNLVTPIETGSAPNPTNANGNLPTVTLGDGDVITGYTGPGTYKDSGGHLISVGSDNLVTPIEIGSSGQSTASNGNLPATADLGNGNTISDYKGPGVYTVSPGNVVSVGSAGDYSFISGTGASGVNVGSTSLPSAQFPTVTLGDGDVITGYTGPGTYKDSGGHLISVGSDNLVTPIETGSAPNPTNANGNLPTVTLGDGDVITGYTGPGTYKDSGGHLISVGSDNLVTPIETGSAPNPTNANGNLPTVTLGDGDVITGYTGPGTYKDSGGHLISVGSDNLVTPIETGSAPNPTNANGNLPTVTLGDGDVITGYTGPGTYKDSGGHLISVGSDNLVTPIETGSAPNPTNANGNLPTVTLGDGDVITGYTGPGTYKDSGGHPISVGSDNLVTPIETGSAPNPTNANGNLPTVTLGDGDVITGYTGPGTYKDSGGHLISVGSDNLVTPIETGSAPNPTNANGNLPTVTLGDGDVITGYTGPGTYKDSGGHPISVGSDNLVAPIETGSAPNPTNANGNLPTVTLGDGDVITGYTGPGTYKDSGGHPISVGSDNLVTPIETGSAPNPTNANGNLPTVTLGDGDVITGYTGPGTYKDSGGHPISVGSDNLVTPIETGSAPNPTNANGNLPTVTLGDGDVITGYTGPGTYKDSGGHLISVGSDNLVTPIEIGSSGQSTASNGNLPATADLGNGNTISDYKGPGVYTVSPGNVVSVGSAGDYSFISGTGASGVNVGSTSLPSAQFPTVTLGDGDVITGYTGPGTYKDSGGHLISVGSDNLVTPIETGSAPNPTNANGNLPTVTLGDGDVITGYTGPGTYKDSGGHLISVGSDNLVTPIETGSAPNPTNANGNLPTVTLGDGDVITGYTGPGTYKDSGGHPISVGSDNLVTPIETGSAPNPTNANGNLPTVTLGDGDVITGYTGPGTYKDSGGHPISVGSDNLVTPIETGSAPNPTNANGNLPTVTLGDGDVITGYTGPGTYKDSGGHLISVGSDNLVTPIEIGSSGQSTASNGNLPATADLGNGNTISDYKGPGVYTVSPGNVVSVGSAGDYSFISGTGASGVNGGSTSLPSAQFPTSTPFNPQSDNATPGFSLSTRPDGVVTSVPVGSIGQQTGSSKLPTANLGNGNTISDYKGPGIYTVSPGNVVSVGSAGDYSFISGTGASGVNVGSTSLPSAQFPTSTPFNPQSDNATPSFRLSTRPDGVVTSVPVGSIGQQTGSSKLPTANLGNGNTISDYKGPGIYTVSPGNVVSVGSAGDYSFISGTGASGVNVGSTSLPSAQFPTSTPFNPQSDNTTPGFSLSTKPDGVVTSVPNGSTGQSFPGITLPNVNLPTLSLGGGISIDHYKGPGVYTISPGNVVSVDASGSFSFISGSGTNGSKQGTLALPNFSLPTISLAGGINLAGFTGPGIYTYSPGNVVSIDSNGSVNWLQGGPKTVSGGGFTFPTPVLPSVTLPNLNLPNLNLNFGNNVPNYHGPGIYTISPGNVVSIDDDGSYSYLMGSGSFGVKSGSISLPTYSLPAITLQGGISVPKYSGPGIYTISPGNILSIGSDGSYKWLQGGPQTLSGGGITLPTYDLSASIPSPSGTYINGVNFKFPFNIPSFNGPGFYSLSPGNVVEVNADGSYSFVSGGPPNPNAGKLSFPSVTLPNINLPTLNLGGSITLGNYKGPGLYTVSPGNVVSIGPGGSFSYISGSGANGNQGGSITLPDLSLPTLSLAGGISLDAFTGAGVYTYSPGNVVSIDGNGGVNWLRGGPQSISGGGFTFPTPALPNINLPSLSLPNANLGIGYSIHNFHGPGIYTISPGNVVSVAADGAYTYLMGSGSLGAKAGTMSLPTYSLPGITLHNGISVSKYNGPGIYTISPGNILSIDSGGGYKWLQGGPQTLSGGGITLPSYDLSGAVPTSNRWYINGVNYKFPFDIPSFNGPGFYSLSPGNVVQVRADGSYTFISGGPPKPNAGKLSFPSVTLPNINFPTLNLGGGITIDKYKGPGVYTLGSGSVVSVAPGGSFSFVSGSGANGVSGGSITLPGFALPTLSLAGGISLDAFTGPGVYTYSPGNVVSIGANGAVDWLAGGPRSVSGGGFTFSNANLPSITLPTLSLPDVNFGVGSAIHNFHGPGIYTVSPGNVVSIAAGGSYTYLIGSGFLGLRTGSMSLPTYNLPGITLQNGISVPKYSGPGIYTVSPGNVLSIGAGGGYKWLQGGPQTLSGGDFTLPSYDLSGSPPMPLETYIGGVHFKFPFDIPSFNGPGFYTLSPGNIVQVHADGSYVFILGGPPNGKISFPSITLPNVNFPTLNLGGGITVDKYKGPGVYTLGSGSVVSVAPGGSFSFVSGSGANSVSGGSITLPDLALPTLSLAGGISLDAFTGPGVYTYSPGNVVSIGANGAVDWLAGGPRSVSGGGFTFSNANLPSITLPTLSLPDVNFGVGSAIHNFHGPGIYTVSPGNVVSIAAGGSYTYLIGSGFLGLRTGSMSLPTYNLPGITLQNGISVPKYSGPGIYTVSPGNVLSIGAGGGYKWLQGGPQTLSGGDFTLPSYDLSGSPPMPLETYIGGVHFKFPFDIPSFNGPGFYTLSPGNVVRVRSDGSYTFTLGGPPNPSGGKITYPSVSLPNVRYSTLNLGGGLTVDKYKGPGVYTLGSGSVVSVAPGGSFSFVSGSGANGVSGGSITLPGFALPTLSLAGGISLDAFTGPGVYTYSPGNVVSIGANGAVDWLAGGPRSVSGGGFTFPSANLPSITLPTITLPNANFGVGYNIRHFHGPGIYTISAGNVLSVAADGSYTYLIGNGFLGAKTGSMNLPTYSLPSITLEGGISVPKYSGPGIYTVSPGNVLSIGADGGYKWLQGGPQTLSGGDFTLPSYDLSGSPPMPLETYINGVHFKFPFDVPSFTGPGFYTLSPGNIVQVHADGSYVFILGGPPNGKISFPSITLPNVNFPTLNLGGGLTVDKYKGPGVYTLGSGSVVSVAPGGSFSFVSGSGANGASGGSITLPDLALPTLSLAGGISLDAFTGPGVYTYSPGNVVSIGANGAVDWLAGGPRSVSGGGFTFPSANLPSITLPTITLPNANFGVGYNIRHFHGPGIYTISAGNVLSVAADGSYTYLIGNGFLGAKTGSMNLPTYSLPSITLEGGISVPKYSGPGIYTVSPGNVLSIGADGGYKWLQGGPQTLSGGDFTLPSYDLSGSPPMPLETYINGVHFKFPFDVPSFTGPGFYTLSPGNVVQVHHDGSYVFVMGGPPGVGSPPISSLPTTSANTGLPSLGGSITLPNLSLPHLDLPNNIRISGYTGPGVYSLGFNTVVSISPNGQYSYVEGNVFFGANTGTVNLPTASFPTLSFAGNTQIPNYKGPGVYTVSPGNVLSIGSDGGVNWLQGGPNSVAAKATSTSQAIPATTTVALPSIAYPGINVPFAGSISAYTGAGVYTINTMQVITISSNGAYSYIVGSGAFGLKNGNLLLPNIPYPTVSLPGGFNVPSYSAPGTYTASPGNVVSIGSNGGFSWVSGGPVAPKAGLATMINNINYNFPFTIPNFTGAGVYTLSSGNVIKVNGDGSYSFTSGGPPALRAAAANHIAYSESNQQASTTASKGFVLPGFSFPSFSRRSVPEDSGSTENIKDPKNQNNFFKNVLSLF